MPTSEQVELERLLNMFKDIGKCSRIKDAFNEDEYLVIRLDGFKQSKAYLKDVLVNDGYNDRLQKSICHTYRSLRSHLSRDFENSFVCACSFNDEVSFVLLGSCSNYERRLMKYCTLFCGVMSSAMTGYGSCGNHSGKGDAVSFDAFDGRPLILNNAHEIAEYIKSRFLLANRQAYWKVLQLCNFPGWDTDAIKGSLDISRALVLENGWGQEYQTIRDAFRFYLPSKNDQKQFIQRTFEDNLSETKTLESDLSKYINKIPRREVCSTDKL